MVNNRRSFLRGLSLVVAAPAVVKAESLMRIVVSKGHELNLEYERFIVMNCAIQHVVYHSDGICVNGVRMDELSANSKHSQEFLRMLRSEWVKECGVYRHASNTYTTARPL